MTQQENPSRLYDQVYAMVRQVPPGKVVSYGQVAKMVGGCSARQVGYAMAGLKDGTDVPWHRVINSQGKLSLPGFGGAMQRKLLEEEGIVFTPGGTIDFDQFGWLPLFPPSQGK